MIIGTVAVLFVRRLRYDITHIFLSPLLDPERTIISSYAVIIFLTPSFLTI